VAQLFSLGIIMHKRRSTIYGYAIRALPVLFVSGFVTVFVGSYFKNDLVMRIGTGIFLSGVAVWGLANGGAFIWAAARAFHKFGIRDFTTHPWSSAFMAFFTVFLVGVGACFLWLTLRAWFTR
jgi:hypothetical protein